MKKINIQSSSFNDQVIYAPGFLKTGQGKPFSVFTPFKRRWVENFDMNFLDIVSHQSKKLFFNSKRFIRFKFVKTHSANLDLWPAGESAAQEKLENFLQLKAKFL